MNKREKIEAILRCTMCNVNITVDPFIPLIKSELEKNNKKEDAQKIHKYLNKKIKNDPLPKVIIDFYDELLNEDDLEVLYNFYRSKVYEKWSINAEEPTQKWYEYITNIIKEEVSKINDN